MTEIRANITPNVFDALKEMQDRAEKQKRTIIWEKWYDPLGADLEEREWPGAFGNMKQDKQLDDHKRKIKVLRGELPDEEEWTENDYKPTSLPKEYAMKNNTKDHVRVISTALGFMAITEHNRAGNVFNFWIGHTNFRLTRTVVEIIEEVDGVESFDIYTPYRFRISIGKAFDASNVKSRLLEELKAQESI